jgi:hypothetical protein
MEEQPPQSVSKSALYQQITLVSPSSKPIAFLTLDLNDSDDHSDPPFTGFFLSYSDNSPPDCPMHKRIVDQFDNMLCKGNSAPHRAGFKKCLSSKTKCDQVMAEVIKKSINCPENIDLAGIHLLSFWFDWTHRTWYLYAFGQFDFFLYNGKVAGSPICPLQNSSGSITGPDFQQIGQILPQKSIHIMFESGLAGDGFFLYCGLPITPSHPIHASPLLSRLFYRLKRDPGPQSQREIDNRLKNTFPKIPDSDLIDAFYLIMAFLPMKKV